MTTMHQWEVEEVLEKHSQLFDMVEKVAQRHTDLLLQTTRSYFELLEKVSQQKQVISAQGNLVNQCMERIMRLEKTADVNMNTLEELIRYVQQLEGRSILGSFNQRIEQLEANKNTFYSIHEKQLPKMMEQLVKRVDELESWLYTHDYAYFQEHEQEEEENQSGNFSFEEHEMQHPYPSYIERDDIP